MKRTIGLLILIQILESIQIEGVCITMKMCTSDKCVGSPNTYFEKVNDPAGRNALCFLTKTAFTPKYTLFYNDGSKYKVIKAIKCESPTFDKLDFIHDEGMTGFSVTHNAPIIGWDNKYPTPCHKFEHCLNDDSISGGRKCKFISLSKGSKDGLKMRSYRVFKADC